MPHTTPVAMVESWGRLIDWKARRVAENGFLVESLQHFDCNKVFDASLGDGCDSIHLLQNGFSVVSNELDDGFIRKAQQNARANNVRLNVTSFDWRRLAKHFDDASFDAVLCLGNSLTYLFKKKDRLLTLKNFWRLLKPGGLLLIDERNYVDMLRRKREMRAPGFAFKNKSVYRGKTIRVRPSHISPAQVVLEYVDQLSGNTNTLHLYPFKKNELENHLATTNFVVRKKLFDYRSRKNPFCEFISYVAQKPFDNFR